MLETLAATNIRNLNIEEPQAVKNLPFDPTEEIDSDLWGGVLSFLDFTKGETTNQTLNGGFIDAFYQSLWGLSILSPDQLLKLNYTREDLLPIFKQGTERARLNTRLHSEAYTDFASYVMYARQLRDIYPELDSFKDQMLSIGYRWELTVALNSAQTTRHDKDPERILQLGGPMKAAFSKIKVEDDSWELVKDYLQPQLTAFANAEPQNPSKFMTRLAYAKIMFPEEFSQLNLGKDFWSNARPKLQLVRDFGFTFEDWISFAASLRILAADEVQITENGLNLIMPVPSKPSFTSVIPALPEMRKF
ncbi:MAG: hypothetical protein Q7R49_01720 [Candidatus Daviesbacteria bacterium]|nr:hypothetical protein [Candidatus Daviesbacteria bacterium]